MSHSASLSLIRSLSLSLCSTRAALRLLTASVLFSMKWATMHPPLSFSCPLCLSVTIPESLHQTEHSCCKAGDHKSCITVLEDFGDGTRLFCQVWGQLLETLLLLLICGFFFFFLRDLCLPCSTTWFFSKLQEDNRQSRLSSCFFPVSQRMLTTHRV